MAIYIYLRNKDLEKIRIWKMGKNSSLCTNLDPLTTSIFWIYNLSSLDLIKYLAYHKSQHQTLLEAKNYLIFSKTFSKISVVDVAYLWFNKLFLFLHSNLNIWHCLHVFFYDKCICSSTFVLDKSFNCSNSLS